MKNTQIINQIESKIREIKTMLTNYKQQINIYEKTLAGLIQKANELKSLENNNIK